MKKIYHFSKIGIYFIAFLTLLQCQKDDLSNDHQKRIETVSFTEAIAILNSYDLSNSKKTTDEELFIVPDPRGIYQEQLINSDELLTIIPAKNKYENVHSRIIFLKINGTIKHLVFNTVKDTRSGTTDFSGKIYLTTLEGNYINAYKIDDGIPVIRYKKPKILPENVQARGEDDCYGITCGMEGEEVYTEGPRKKGSGWGNEEEEDWFDDTSGWNYGEGESGVDGGGGSSSPNVRVDDHKIDASGLTGNAACVYNKMVDGNNNINWILKNFKDGTNPSEFDLVFEMFTTLSNSTNASTVKSG